MDYSIKLHNIKESCNIENCASDAIGFAASKIINNFKNQNRDVILIVQNDVKIEEINKQIRFFSDKENSFTILNFNAWDCLPYDRVSPKQIIMNERIKNLYKIANRQAGQKFLIITSVNAVTQKVINANLVKNLGFFAKIGDQISIDEIAKFLIFNGYQRSASANNVGEFAMRGGIVDIVTQIAADLVGYRLDFFGDKLESIKAFDPLTQLSQERVREISILPASEVILNEKTVENFRKNYRQLFGTPNEDELYNAISQMRIAQGMEHWLPLFYEENLVSIFDYLCDPVIFNSGKNDEFFAQRFHQINEYFLARKENIKESKLSGALYNPIQADLLYLEDKEIEEIFTKNVLINFIVTQPKVVIPELDFVDEQSESTKSSSGIQNIKWIPDQEFLASKLARNSMSGMTNTKDRKIDLEIKPIPDFASAAIINKKPSIELMQEFLSFLIDERNQKKILFTCPSKGFLDRLQKILLDHNIICKEIENLAEIKNLKANQHAICIAPFDLGFFASDLIIIDQQAILGEKIHIKKSNKQSNQRILQEALNIAVGDIVTHRQHGIGKFEGIQTIEVNKIKNDFLKISYHGTDSLFVPVEDINLITRYSDFNPMIQLDKLGSKSWRERKNKVRHRIRIAAEKLLQIAATRQLKKAPILIAQPELYEEFKAKFAFEETPDQLRAINEVEEDLAKGAPMDRLICGDVGFGKTEVIMRAAFIAARAQKNSCQIAIIAPTTLLVRQHFANFKKRFEGTDIKIAQLSRLVSTKESAKIRSELESGHLDIVIATHSLLQKNIKFKNLGLVIIDEEQHFGVAQKERLKELCNETHLLSLSATPIPRTLQMSLSGVKELSLIATPPPDRLAVRNFIIPFDLVIVREAIIREYQRGGKTFFVVPRIKDLQEIQEKITNLVPEIRSAVANGQMTPHQLDEIMNNFYDDKIDLLLSTTIIESGIDISSANTIIIYKAEMFGLAQLYQLRGRVGRGKIRGYCYFMTSAKKKLTAESKKKLEVMQNLDNLGVGFSVASHDMDIRGSGNLVGDEQSGHIKETGVELYQQMLMETIEKLKNNPDYKIPQNADEESWQDLTTQIKLGISLLIPENYISDLGLRIAFYKRIAAIKNEDEKNQMIIELTDRFKDLPQEVMNLIDVALLKQACKKLAIEKLEVNKDGILISFKDNKFSAPEKLLQKIFASKNQIKLVAGQKVLFCKNVNDEQVKIEAASLVVQELESL